MYLDYVFGVLNNFFIHSLLQIYGSVFAQIYSIVPDVGWAIVLFGFAINLLLLPVYYQMERASQKGSKTLDAMNAEIARIRAHYKGRERYYYTRAIFRQFNYRPINVIFSSGDLYLQVLVFATVYRFIASLDLIFGSRFYIISDLSQPDHLLFGTNLLPLIMTFFNVVSAVLYSGDKAKRRNAFILAGLFLVLLYRSPSGLVLYWTFNNAFSLVRNFIDRKLIRLVPERLTRSISRVVNQV
jgi:membrane protein insertase Oxa1/YidC/SpoIIIJ